MVKEPVTVAVVDDHTAMRQFMGFRLSCLGYHVVIEAENGQKFLERLRDSIVPTICLLDVNMPVMDGFETLTYLKKHWPSIKVLFFSMNDDQSFVNKALALGADGYIVKGAPFNELHHALQQALQK